MLEIIAKCQEKVKAGDMHIDYMKKIFSMIKNKYKEEYVMHRLKFVAAELVGPLVIYPHSSFLYVSFPH